MNEAFERVWQRPSGYARWFTPVNNQIIGQRYMVTSLIFFVLGGVLALLIRLQLAVSENDLMGPEVYNQLFTMHGSTMMYLFAVPFLEGLSLYMVPLMLGARDVAFPRLSAFGFWCYLFGGGLIYSSFIIGSVPDMGWFAYTPLSDSAYSGFGTDLWVLGLGLVEIAGLTAAAEIVVTILKSRAPGMAIQRMPLFIWTMLAASLMILFAFTTLLTATLMLELDRTIDTQFFDARHGGSSLLWQHLFWFFGHPEVYIMFLPATGIVSMIVPTFARRPLAAYTLVAVAVVVTAFVSFGLWVHHMFTTGLPKLSMSFFTAASLMIAIASGIQVFAWIGTLWGSRPALKVPLLYVLGFLFLFVLGGMTGVMVAVVPFDWQVHDTFFVVAHFHYVLIGGVVFPILAGLYYWVPKMSGRLMNETLGKWGFWLTFIGFNVTFFPMHAMGLLGMPRRVYTYPASLQLDGYNMVATIGSFLLAIGFLIFLVDVLFSVRWGPPAPDNPWEAPSLEWSMASPPPVFSFYRPPLVGDRYPLWDRTTPQLTIRAIEAMTGEPTDIRATLTTDALNGDPQAIQYLPGPTPIPLIAALGLTVASIGVLAKFFLLGAVGLIVTIGALVAWLWPDDRLVSLLRDHPIVERSGLSLLPTGTRSTAWWGMLSLIVILATGFGALLYSYFYIQLYSRAWPQDGLPLPSLLLPTLAIASLVASGIAQFLAGRGWRWTGLGGSLALGLGYLLLQAFDLSGLGFPPQSNAYASLVYTLSILMLLVVLVGLTLNGATLIRLWQEREGGFLPLQLEVSSLYWFATVAVGIVVYATVTLSPYLLGGPR